MSDTRLQEYSKSRGNSSSAKSGTPGLELNIDMNTLLNRFASLSPSKQRSVHVKALKAASGILIKETRKNVKQLFGSHATTRRASTTDVSFRKSGYLDKGTKATSLNSYDSLTSGVRGNVNKEGTMATVNIMGDFRLKWFELGTKGRNTKKGLGRGFIQAHYFFRSAQKAVGGQAFNVVRDILTKSIQKTMQ